MNINLQPSHRLPLPGEWVFTRLSWERYNPWCLRSVVETPNNWCTPIITTGFGFKNTQANYIGVQDWNIWKFYKIDNPVLDHFRILDMLNEIDTYSRRNSPPIGETNPALIYFTTPT